MKCIYCGYEVKPNLKTCPLCGKRVSQGDILSEEEHCSSEQTPVEIEASGNVEAENSVTRNIEPRRGVDTVPEETSFDLSHDAPSHENAASYSYDDNPPVSDDTTNRVSPGAKTNSVERTAPQPISHYPQKDVMPENPDQYVENGSYHPYPDEVEESGYDNGVVQPESQSSVWMVTLGATIAGLVIGSILYFVIR